eukprot:CAMPEP_0183314384 /NCGR_PEP_ID=MMETSP0160_2-20130417/48276_1 /TAXON_ID=2839 ORGANISM="Odontella Sinensis, Strain Grunow 1884" /NCGR_SAMPLE_ID=MMETSP0160_2 /ASSEMBLY_ACC=CAM_ASM_000250 /LENGTH=70 /DNA_ID=CAMNT_0025479703 /DNA_START=153 /DNA_END=365 /DNA_ORIENTATION=+
MEHDFFCASCQICGPVDAGDGPPSVLVIGVVSEGHRVIGAGGFSGQAHMLPRPETNSGAAARAVGAGCIA